jgi:aryl-alcohol dehydrogenase-like predicted oxidoreductase
MDSHRLTRRGFLKAAGAATGATLALTACVPIPASTGEGAQAARIPRRTLGKTGALLSVVGFGGIVVMNETPESAAELVKQAVERSVNYFDVAPSYGNAEERLGPALEPYREGVFLACKTEKRDRAGAEADLKRSLERLRTDHFDLYQFHHVTYAAEVEQIFGPKGAMEAFQDARERGVIGRIGFSAHGEEAALAMLDRFAWDSILYPVNYVCWNQGNFGPSVVARAGEMGIGILALKALAKEQGRSADWPKCWYKPAETAEEASLGLRWTLSQPVTAAVSPSHAEHLWWMCDAAEDLTPITEAEAQQMALASEALTPIFSA